MPLVNSGTTPPPRRPAPKTAPKPKASAPNPDKIRNEREEAVNGIFQLASAGLIMANQWADAGAINIHGPNVSRETVRLADKYEAVGNAIDALASVGPFTAIIGAVMPLVLQIAANHKRLPAEKLGALGIKDPRVLESEMRTEAQRQANAYAHAVANAEAELAAEQAMYDEMPNLKDIKAEMRRETVPVS